MGMPDIDGLRELVRGEIVTAADPGYDDARTVHNAMIDRRPCSSPAAPVSPT